jgi:hypothetical protein
MSGVTRWTLAGLLFCALALGACSGSGSSDAPAQPPPAPAGLAATAGSGAVALTWSPVAGATSYSAYRGNSAGALSSKAKLGTATTTAFNDATVSDGTRYFYQVTASNAGGESSGSSEVSATPSALLPPVAPSGVTATDGTNEVTIAWDPVPGATSYDLYWATTSPVTTGSTKITGASSPYVHSSLTGGTTYHYAVAAVNGSGASNLSAEVSATPSSALPPPFIQARVVRWTLPNKPSGVPIQEVRICTDSSCATPVADATVQVNSTVLAWSPVTQQYVGNVMPAVAYTSTLTVTIPAGSTVAAGTYTATGATYATAPSVTAPATSTTWSRATAHDLTWTAGAPTATTPASVYVVAVNDAIGDFYPSKPDGSATEVPISATTFTMPANALPVAGTYIAWVAIGTTGIAGRTAGGIPIPGAAAGSALYIGYASGYVTFTVTD